MAFLSSRTIGQRAYAIFASACRQRPPTISALTVKPFASMQRRGHLASVVDAIAVFGRIDPLKSLALAQTLFNKA
jgi:hypothetical protein